MFSSLNYNILILMVTLFFSAFGNEKEYDICSPISNVICVKSTLLDIASAAKEVHHIANKIEKFILQLEPTSGRLDTVVSNELNRIRSKILTSQYHYDFMNVYNNINKTVLIHLIEEENYAYSYIYNSIKYIRTLRNLYDTSTRKWFREILDTLPEKILCKYRNILYVYSKPWLSTDQIGRIPMLETRKRNAPSFNYNSYSIIVVRLLGEWMKHVENLVKNIDNMLL